MIEHFLSYFKVDLLLIKSVSSLKRFFVFFVFVLLIILECVFNEKSYIFQFIMILFFASIMGAFFYKLKKENYFHFLSLNRYYYSLFLEIFAFLFPFFCFAFLLDIPYLFLNRHNFVGILNIMMVAETLCLVFCWFYRYFILHIIISFVDYILNFDINNITAKQNISSLNVNNILNILMYQKIDIFMTIFSIFIEIMFVCIVLKRSNKSKK